MPRKKAPPGALLKRPLTRPYIQQWRDRAGLTQEQVATRVEDILGTSFTAATLSRIENAKSPYNQRQLEAIAEALGREPWELLNRDPEKEGEVVDITDLLRDARPELRTEILGYVKGRLAAGGKT